MPIRRNLAAADLAAARLRDLKVPVQQENESIQSLLSDHNDPVLQFTVDYSDGENIIGQVQTLEAL